MEIASVAEGYIENSINTKKIVLIAYLDLGLEIVPNQQVRIKYLAAVSACRHRLLQNTIDSQSAVKYS
ncbi:hypothetical protein NQ315_013062 [Exocentrus adspersus]|uniref:Uncharacterized protein n=1 Tax=Exocentrus adspersus TaxID=1586481 RepID=A0AAV8VW05_9CUCU|nr:hypothetical protein NQ315_013062 [Exocentrus adspersus]